MPPHIVLLGDSTLDNGAYTAGGPDVLAQVRAGLPNGWRADSLAIDGSTTADIATQLPQVPRTATHLVVSVGGNNALLRADLLDTPVSSSGEALGLLDAAITDFGKAYRAMLDACLALGRPLAVFTIYNGRFEGEAERAAARAAIGAFNDVISRAARESAVPVVELRDLCNSPEHFANPIEPSVLGGQRIAEAIVAAVRRLESAPKP